MKRKLIIGFSKYTEAAFESRATLIINSLGPTASPNPAFPEPWPAEYPSRVELAALLADYLAKKAEADDGDAGAIVARNNARKLLSDKLAMLAPHLEAVANGDVVKLESTGYELTKVRTPAGPGPIPPPTDVKLVNGETTGMMIGRGKKQGRPSGFEAQIGDGDTAGENGRGERKLSTGCQRIEFTALTPGQKYKLRIRAIGPNGPGDWSDEAHGRCL